MDTYTSYEFTGHTDSVYKVIIVDDHIYTFSNDLTIKKFNILTQTLINTFS